MNKKQIGLRAVLGCDLNLISLRERVNEVISLPGKDQKYVLFIDLKAAFDCVNHRKLFLKMRHSTKRCRTGKLEHNLLIRLVKNVNMYLDHFGEYPEIYRKALDEYTSRLIRAGTRNKLEVLSMI